MAELDLNSPEFVKMLMEFGVKEETDLLSMRTKYSPKGMIVFLGDSITAQHPFNETLPGYPILNRGVSGDMTKGVLSRLESQILCLEPKKIFLLIGTNDIGNHVPEEETKANLAAICKTIQEKLPACPLYVSSVLPINPNIPRPTFNAVAERNNQDVERLNDYIRTLPGITYIDAYPHFTDENGMLNKKYTHDGLHLNYEGQRLYAALVKPYLGRSL